MIELPVMGPLVTLQTLSGQGSADVVPSRNGHQQKPTYRRLSSLAGPTMLLTAHEDEVFCARFCPRGQFLATAGFDRNIFLWEATGSCTCYGPLTGHGGAIMELSWNSCGSELASCATDRLIYIWDVGTVTRVKKFKGHKSFVNSIDFSDNNLICSGSDDGSVKVWDRREKFEKASLDGLYPVLTCCFSDSKETVYSAGLDDVIKIWDLRVMKESARLLGHADSVTGLALSPSKYQLASNSMDGTVRVWDLKPYSVGDRCVAVLAGHQHNFEKNLLRVHWSADGARITAGSADRCVHIWTLSDKRLLYKLSGHTGSVNETDFHPKEPIVASASSDKAVYLGEIE